MNAAKEQAIGAHRLPELRDAEAAAAAAFQRLSIARAQIEEEAGRIRARQAELDKRSPQLDADIAREEQMVRDNADMLQRLDDGRGRAERRECRRGGARGQAPARRSKRPRRRSPLSEAALAALTAERAEAAAARSQIERTLRESSRAPRPAGAPARRRRSRGRRDRAPGSPDLPIRPRNGVLVEQATLAARQRRAGGRCRRKGGRRGARSARPRAPAGAGGARRARPHRDRGAHAGEDPECRERRPVSRLCSSRSRSSAAMRRRWARRSAKISTCRSIAARRRIGARASRSRRSGAAGRRAPPGQPSCRRRAQLARRLAQIGIVEAAEGARLQALLTPGQRLVSREGALWRWDGFTASADAPTAAAQRLAQKNRLAELDAEAVAATKRVRVRPRRRLPTAEARACARRAEAERRARQAWRDAQHAARRGARCAGAGREGGRRDCRAAAPRSPKRRRASPRAMPRPRRRSPRPKRSSPPRPTSATAVAARPHGRRRLRATARLLPTRAPRHDGLKREAEARDPAAGSDRRRAHQLDRARARMPTAQIASLAERRAEAMPRAGTLADAPDEIDARRRALLSQLSEAESAAQGGGRPAAGGREHAGRAGQGRDRCDPGAGRSAREPRPRRRAADRRRRAAPRGRGAHPGGAEHAAASGHPPHRARSPTPACRIWPMSSAGSNG